MQRIALQIEYDGTAYAGWQRQHNAVTVQAVLEQAYYKLTGQAAVIHGASRTDAGVHALGQVAHLDSSAGIPADRLCYALNTHLPGDIRVVASQAVDDNFHSRFMAKQKTYQYAFYTAPHASALLQHRAWHIFHPLDVDAMQQAAQDLLGRHDFIAFRATGGNPNKTTVREIYQAELFRQDRLLILQLRGNAFLYNMVRIIAGTLMYIGVGKLPTDAVRQMLETKQRTLGGPTAPPDGLTLVRVEYDPPLFLPDTAL